MSQPITILRVIARLNIGGPARQAMFLSQALNDGKWHTVLVSGSPDRFEGDLAGRLDASVTSIRLPSLQRAIYPLKDLVAWCQLLRIMYRERPDILHTHTAKAGALGRTAAMVYNVTRRLQSGWTRRAVSRCVIIHTFHGHILEGYFSPVVSRIFLVIERWLARRTDCLVTVSQAVQDELRGMGIGRPEQWRVVPLGLNLSTLADLPLPNGQSAVRFGMVGRLVPIKNPALFLDALRRVNRGRAARPVVGTLVGDGPLRPTLEQEAKRLGLEEVVRFMGWQEDLCSVYKELEAACLTSWNEGTPVSLIEAMAAGRPVVATDVGGVRDLLEESRPPADIPRGKFRVTERGVLVRPGDAEGFAAALTTIAGDAQLRFQLGQAARAYVVRRFGQERLLADIRALYEECQRRRRG